MGERWCYRPRQVAAVITVSSGVRDEMRRHFPAVAGRLVTIPHGVDVSRFRPDPAARGAIRRGLGLGDDVPMAVFVGGDWERKGLSHALEAIARTDTWHLLVVGRGHRNSYERQADRLTIGGRIHFVGETREVPAQLAAADVLLLPTRYETFCLVAFEAAAAGCRCW